MAQAQVIYQLEDHINDWVKDKFKQLHLKNQQDYYTESAIPDHLKEALKGRAKTENKTNFGKPDFSLLKNNQSIPVVIENKLGSKYIVAENKGKIKFDPKSVVSYAVNGALHYATGIIASAKYRDVIAIGISGDCAETIKIQVYYVYGSGEHSYKLLDTVSTLDFLENEHTFKVFYDNAVLTEDEKHDILISSRAQLQNYAKKLNRLMHNLNITAPQRVLYVSGTLLAMHLWLIKMVRKFKKV